MLRSRCLRRPSSYLSFYLLCNLYQAKGQFIYLTESVLSNITSWQNTKPFVVSLTPCCTGVKMNPHPSLIKLHLFNLYVVHGNPPFHYNSTLRLANALSANHTSYSRTMVFVMAIPSSVVSTMVSFSCRA